MNKVTVGLICHNEEPNIDYCLASLLTQENLVHIQQVIVVDNASTDGSLQRLRDWELKHPELFKVIPSEQNLVGGGRQLVVEHCETELLFFTDADCVVPTNWIALMDFQMLRILSKENSGEIAGFCGPNRLPEHHNWQIAINLFLNSPLGHMRSPQAWIPGDTVLVDHLPTTNCCFRMDALKKTQGFKRELMTGEDAEMGHQLQALGLKMFLFPQPVVTNACAATYQEWLWRMFRFGGAQWNHSYKRTLMLWLVVWGALIFKALHFPILLLILMGFMGVLINVVCGTITASAYQRCRSQRMALLSGFYGTLSLFAYALGALLRMPWPMSRRT